MNFIADLIACSTCFGHHYTHHQELETIIEMVAVCGIWCLVFKSSIWCGAEGNVSGLQAVKQQPANRTHNTHLHTIPTTWKPKHQIPQAATTCIILLRSWWWVYWCPKHVEQAIRSAIKIHLLHLVGILFPHIKVFIVYNPLDCCVEIRLTKIYNLPILLFWQVN